MMYAHGYDIKDILFDICIRAVLVFYFSHSLPRTNSLLFTASVRLVVIKVSSCMCDRSNAENRYMGANT